MTTDKKKNIDFTTYQIDISNISSSACLIYQFSKPGVSTSMPQTFDTKDGKISSILLIFDTGAFQSESKEK